VCERCRLATQQTLYVQASPLLSDRGLGSRLNALLWELKSRAENTGQVRVIGSLEQYAQSPFPQCETSIGNISGSIKHKAVKFASIIGFSDMADRMLSPSLSRDWKWPRITKCTYSQVITFRLECNLVNGQFWLLSQLWDWFRQLFIWEDRCPKWLRNVSVDRDESSLNHPLISRFAVGRSLTRCSLGIHRCAHYLFS